MADDCEIASEISERWLASALAAAAVPEPGDVFVPNGQCRWCKDPVDDGLSFCPTPEGETGCRDDWLADQERKKRAGRIV